MKKIKSCLAGLLLSLVFLSGCGMARDGYIEDLPAQTNAPMESPYIHVSPLPSDMHRDEETQMNGKTSTDRTVKESPTPDDEQDETAEP